MKKVFGDVWRRRTFFKNSLSHGHPPDQQVVPETMKPARRTTALLHGGDVKESVGATKLSAAALLASRRLAPTADQLAAAREVQEASRHFMRLATEVLKCWWPAEAMAAASYGRRLKASGHDHMPNC